MKCTPAYLVIGLVIACSGFANAAKVPPRAARSVHLFYQAPSGNIFFNALRIKQSQPGSYFQVCGFSQGYFGLQELASKKHIIIFSTWDSNHQPVRVTSCAPDVHVSRFGGEGTGAHILISYAWHTGITYHFAVVSRRIGRRTAYAAWFYQPGKQNWKHLVTLATVAGKSAGQIHGYYAFIEDFRRNTRSARQVRRALYGPGWIRKTNGQWMALTRAVFSTSNAPWEAKKTVDAGIIKEQFYLQTGGQTHMHSAPGTLLKLARYSRKPPHIIQKLLTALLRKKQTRIIEHAVGRGHKEP